MRLLSKQEVKAKDSAYREALAHERTDLSDAVITATRKLAALKTEYADRTLLLKKEYDLVFQELRGQEQELRLMVESLEYRQKEALKPLKERIQAVERLEKEAREKALQIDVEKKEALAERSVLVQMKAAVSDKQALLDERERNIAKRTNGILSAERLNKESTEALANAWADFHKDMQTREASLGVEKTMLASERESLNKEKEWIAMMKRNIAEEQAKIASEKAKLEVAFKDLQRRQR